RRPRAPAIGLVDRGRRHRPPRRPSAPERPVPLHRSPAAGKSSSHRGGRGRGGLRAAASRRRSDHRHRSFRGGIVTEPLESPAFDDFVNEHRGRVYGVALRVVSDPELAADVVQETFLRAWRGLARFRGESQISTWLHRIAVNTALTARRRAARDENASLDSIDEVVAESTPYVDPERRGEVLDLRARLEAALDSLPPGQKAVVVLKDMEGWSHAEIADRLGISESAAKVRLHRAHRKLAQLLEADG